MAKAAAAAQAALALHSHHAYVQAQLCTAYAHTGRLNDARAIQADFTAANDSDDADGCAFDIAIGDGRLDDARKIVDGMAAKFSTLDLPAADMGDNYAVAGDYPSALIWLQRGYDAKEFQLFPIGTDRAIAQSFFDGPGWKALLKSRCLRIGRPRMTNLRATSLRPRKRTAVSVRDVHRVGDSLVAIHVEKNLDNVAGFNVGDVRRAALAENGLRRDLIGPIARLPLATKGHRGCIDGCDAADLLAFQIGLRGTEGNGTTAAVPFAGAVIGNGREGDGSQQNSSCCGVNHPGPHRHIPIETGRSISV